MQRREGEMTMENTHVYKSENGQIAIETLYCVGGYVTYKITVSTVGFAGESSICLYEPDIQTCVFQLDQMSDSLQGSLEICDGESDDFVRLEFDGPLKLYLNGQIGGSHRDNYLHFKFQVDQTILPILKKSLLDYSEGK